MSADAPEFIDTLHGHALARHGLLLLTDDGGQQWRGVQAPGGTVRFADARKGWAFAGSSAAGGAAPFVTSDGGATWRPLPRLPVYRVLAAWVLGPDRLMVNGYTMSDYELLSFLSEDGGRTWRSLGLEFTGVTPTGLLYAEEIHRLRLSTNGGATSRVLMAYEVFGEPLAKDLSDPARLQLIVNGEHRASSDGGVTWTGTPVVTPPGIVLSATPGPPYLEGNVGWAAGDTPSADRVLLRSGDGGRHWSTAALPPEVSGPGEVMTFGFHGPALLTVQNFHGAAWVSRDAATSWQPVRPPGDPADVLAVESAGGGVLRLAMGETTTTIPPGCFHSRCIYTQDIVHRRYVSTDGGATWRLMPGGQPITP